MVTAEMAGQYEAPIYGMLAVEKTMDKMDWNGLQKPGRYHGQPLDESKIETLALGRRGGKSRTLLSATWASRLL